MYMICVYMCVHDHIDRERMVGSGSGGCWEKKPRKQSVIEKSERESGSSGLADVRQVRKS